MKSFTLRTIGISINIKGRLFGNSMFWVFTRVKDNIEVNKPICILKKMPDSQRIFCIFGQMVEKITSISGDSNRYQNMGKYEENMDEVERIKMLTQ